MTVKEKKIHWINGNFKMKGCVVIVVCLSVAIVINKLVSNATKEDNSPIVWVENNLYRAMQTWMFVRIRTVYMRSQRVPEFGCSFEIRFPIIFLLMFVSLGTFINFQVCRDWRMMSYRNQAYSVGYIVQSVAWKNVSVPRSISKKTQTKMMSTVS